MTWRLNIRNVGVSGKASFRQKSQIAAIAHWPGV